MFERPTRCIDPVIKLCQDCPWGWIHYPEWVETTEDLQWCTIESGCSLGYDQGRAEDEPTEEELREFDEWCREMYTNKRFGHCPICDEDIKINSNESMCHCPTCGHDIVLHTEEEYEQ